MNNKKVGLTMPTANSRSTMKAIIKAYRNNALVIVALPIQSNNLAAKRNVREFGPITDATNLSDDEALYVYDNVVERIRIVQYISRRIDNIEPDTRRPQVLHVTKERQSDIERAIINAYRNGAQFIVAHEPVHSAEDARKTLRFFGKAKRSKTEDGRTQYLVDDIQRQVKAIVNIGLPK